MKRLISMQQMGIAACSLALGLAMAGLMPAAFVGPAHAAPRGQSAQAQITAMADFNVNTFKYHNPHCKWAIRCTSSCIRITRAEAIRRGGIPCKVCGGK